MSEAINPVEEITRIEAHLKTIPADSPVAETYRTALAQLRQIVNMSSPASAENDENMPVFTPGLPYFIYTPGGGALRYFEVKLDTGEVTQAFVDPSNQYFADGPTWRRRDGEDAIPKHRVLGFRCIDGDPAFPERKK